MPRKKPLDEVDLTMKAERARERSWEQRISGERESFNMPDYNDSEE